MAGGFFALAFAMLRAMHAGGRVADVRRFEGELGVYGSGHSHAKS
jgi:hypothetical protein